MSKFRYVVPRLTCETGSRRPFKTNRGKDHRLIHLQPLLLDHTAIIDVRVVPNFRLPFAIPLSPNTFTTSGRLLPNTKNHGGSRI